MRNIFLTVALGSLISCGGGGSDDPEPVQNVPVVNPGDTNCDGDVSFNTTIPDPVVPDVSPIDISNESPGIINPAVSKAVDAADFQGLKIIRMARVEGATIIATCGSTINIGGDPVTNNNPAPVS